jgi:nucleotide-binding universal stress UspA family protein
MMKKIIIPFDGGHFSQGAFSFARKLNDSEPLLLAGIFLPSVEYARFFFLPSAFSEPAFIPLNEKYNDEETEAAVKQFEKLCTESSIGYHVHRDNSGTSLEQLQKETRFADLMIIGSETFYKEGSGYGSSEFLKDALHNTECPVILVPEEYQFPSRIILAYDGSASSVYAIRQFAQLLPRLCSLDTILVFAGNNSVPDKELIQELTAMHFAKLTMTQLSTENNDVNKWFSSNRGGLIVSGSFGRSNISRLFTKSFIMEQVRSHSSPIFIAHH